MKIIITENQFKYLVDNIIKEEYYDPSDDPRALVLIDYLNDTETGEMEYGLGGVKREIELEKESWIGNYMNLYIVNDIEYGVSDKEQFEKFVISDLNLSKNMVHYNNYYIYDLNRRISNEKNNKIKRKRI